LHAWVKECLHIGASLLDELLCFGRRFTARED
jgi:hypothetical protein